MRREAKEKERVLTELIEALTRLSARARNNKIREMEEKAGGKGKMEGDSLARFREFWWRIPSSWVESYRASERRKVECGK